MNDSVHHKIALPSHITGKSILFHLAEPNDAAFILSLRLDESLNKFVSKVDGTEQHQRDWLSRYKDRERRGEEAYFVIKLPEGTPVGTVRLYDYQDGAFSWGSWMIKKSAPHVVSIESALLVYEIAFYRLMFQKAHFVVCRDNERVVAFHQRFGAQITHSDDQNHFFTFSKEDYEKIREKYLKFLPVS